MACGKAKLIPFVSALFLLSCSGNSNTASAPSTNVYTISLSFTRINSGSPNPFQVLATLTKDGTPLAGQTLTKTVPQGTSSGITDNGDGSYSFTVTPTTTGSYPVTVSFASQSTTRTAVVLDSYGTGVGQPMAVPGDYVNTMGYEDGATITPDGEYLFIQYGPFYFSGIANFATICSSGSYTSGYDLNTCSGRTNSSLVFNTVGPFNNSLRPLFPIGGISGSTLLHLPSLVLAGTANGIVGFPTVFYGFKRQSDGTFAEPFKVSFNDERGLNGPFGLSFKMNGGTSADFVVAWNNYFNDLGDGGADIYTGSLTLGQDKNLGDVSYSGEAYASITPTVSPVNLTPQTGQKGNPSLYYDNTGVKSIFTDDEVTSHDLSAYRLTSGNMTSGTWVRDTLPSGINTGADERQPTFTGTELIFTRDSTIVSHAYQPTNGACASGYTHANCWGSANTLLSANGHTAVGEIGFIGEPTVATIGGQKILYFVYVQARANSNITGIVDWDINVASVSIP